MVAVPPPAPSGLLFHYVAIPTAPTVMRECRQCPANVITDLLLRVQPNKNRNCIAGPRVAQGGRHGPTKLWVTILGSGLQDVHGAVAADSTNSQSSKNAETVLQRAAVPRKKTGKETQLFRCCDACQLLDYETPQFQVGGFIV